MIKAIWTGTCVTMNSENRNLWTSGHTKLARSRFTPKSTNVIPSHPPLYSPDACRNARHLREYRILLFRLTIRILDNFELATLPMMMLIHSGCSIYSCLFCRGEMILWKEIHEQNLQLLNFSGAIFTRTRKPKQFMTSECGSCHPYHPHGPQWYATSHNSVHVASRS